MAVQRGHLRRRRGRACTPRIPGVRGTLPRSRYLLVALQMLLVVRLRPIITTVWCVLANFMWYRLSHSAEKGTHCQQCRQQFRCFGMRINSLMHCTCRQDRVLNADMTEWLL